MNHVDMDPVVDEFVEKVVGSGDGLNEDEGWRSELTGGDEGTEGEEFAGFGSGKGESLGDEGRGCVSVSERDGGGEEG